MVEAAAQVREYLTYAGAWVMKAMLCISAPTAANDRNPV
jgi:hypothetical protein